MRERVIILVISTLYYGNLFLWQKSRENDITLMMLLKSWFHGSFWAWSHILYYFSTLSSSHSCARETKDRHYISITKIKSCNFKCPKLLEISRFDLLRSVRFFQFSAVCLQFPKKSATPKTHFGLHNLWSRKHIYGATAIWICNFWFWSPCIHQFHEKYQTNNERYIQILILILTERISKPQK